MQQLPEPGPSAALPGRDWRACGSASALLTLVPPKGACLRSNGRRPPPHQSAAIRDRPWSQHSTVAPVPCVRRKVWVCLAAAAAWLGWCIRASLLVGHNTQLLLACSNVSTVGCGALAVCMPCRTFGLCTPGGACCRPFMRTTRTCRGGLASVWRVNSEQCPSPLAYMEQLLQWLAGQEAVGWSTPCDAAYTAGMHHQRVAEGW